VNTLRARLVLLLAVLIVSVVGILTAVLFYALRPPGGHHIEPVAEQVLILARAANEARSALPRSLSPAPGRVSYGLTERLNAALSARGATFAVVVSRADERSPQVVSIPVGSEWAITPIPDLPPPDGGTRILGTWLALIAVGALAISGFVAHRMLQPLVLLERTIAAVGSDGLLPEMPVKGPAEVRMMAQALNSLSARLKLSMESRMRLVAAAGHDMRTPITRMRLRAEFVPDGDERTMWLKDIDELERIADSAILLVREETRETQVETFELGELVRDVAEELQALDYRVKILETARTQVRASRHILRRALRNLIINAATHGQAARVHTESAGTRARVVIEDDGPGIPPELLGQVFEPFFRADPARRQNVPGAGLGLTIAREIVRRTGGDIKISNGARKGLVQLVEIPALATTSRNA
jgi:signal transduction histidine kinase